VAGFGRGVFLFVLWNRRKILVRESFKCETAEVFAGAVLIWRPEDKRLSMVGEGTPRS